MEVVVARLKVALPLKIENKNPGINPGVFYYSKKKKRSKLFCPFEKNRFGWLIANFRWSPVLNWAWINK